MDAGLAQWHSICPSCGYEASTLIPAIGSGVSTIDESIREEGLKSLRTANFIRLVDLLAENGLRRGATVVDVGCGHGWFLKTLIERGYGAIGIEPDENVACRNLQIRRGLFPHALDDMKIGSCDALSFNDVLEHLPDVIGVAQSCNKLLQPGGLLLVNAPDSAGPIYRVAKQLKRIGIDGPFERMWQKGLPSPHLSYFNQNSLRRLFEQSEFTMIAVRRVDSVSRKGLWQRVNYTKTSLPVALAAYIAGFIGKSFLSKLPSDTNAYLFRKLA